MSTTNSTRHDTRWLCLPCIGARKMAQLERDAGADVALPIVRHAVTMLGGTPHCYEHIAVQRQSPLAVPGPNGALVVPGT